MYQEYSEEAISRFRALLDSSREERSRRGVSREVT